MQSITIIPFFFFPVILFDSKGRSVLTLHLLPTPFSQNTTPTPSLFPLPGAYTEVYFHAHPHLPLLAMEALPAVSAVYPDK